MKKQLHPEAVEFDAMECCAMERASAQEACQCFVQEYMVAVCKTHPQYKTSVLLGIFEHAFHLAFIPSDIHRTLYAQLAAMEKAALEKQELGDEMLECGHATSEHCKALDAVWVKMQPRTFYKNGRGSDG